MTVLVVADVFFPDTIGGAGRVARQLAEGLAGEHEVIVACRNEGGRLASFEQAGRLQIHRFLVDRSSSDRFLRSAVQNAAALIRQLRREHAFNRLIIHQPLAGVAAFGLTRSVPTVYVFHSPWAEEYRTQIRPTASSLAPRQRAALLSRSMVEGALIRRAKRVTVLSQYMRRELRRAHHTPLAKTAIIPGGVDLERFHPGSRLEARRRLALPEDSELVLTVRNLMPRMGLSALVEGFQAVAASHPSAQLVIAGDGPLKAHLEAHVARAGLAGRARLLGRVPEEVLPDLYRAADLFVMATQALEGFGLATIEALACGTPVVATPVGASPEILSQLDLALVAASSEPAGIASAVMRVLELPREERERLAQRGRELCAEQYSWPRITRAFNELVRSLE